MRMRFKRSVRIRKSRPDAFATDTQLPRVEDTDVEDWMTSAPAPKGDVP